VRLIVRLVHHQIVETRLAASIILGTNADDHRTPITLRHPLGGNLPQPIVEALFRFAL
jgi:hypothetical protein